MTENYDVGYCKPPKKHQWQKGQSGNPLGKKKQKKVADPIPDLVADVLSDPVSVQVDGKKQTMSTGLALAKSMVRNALQAPLKDQLATMEKLSKLGVFESQKHKIYDAQEEEDKLTDAELELIKDIQLLLQDDEWEDELESSEKEQKVEAAVHKSNGTEETVGYDELDLEHGMLSFDDPSDQA